ERAQLARNVEGDVLARGDAGLDLDVVALGEGFDHLVDQRLGRRGTGGDAERADAFEAAPVDLGGAVDEHGNLAARTLRYFHQSQRIGGVWRADDDHRVHFRGNGLDGLLPVGGGVTDVFLVRPTHRG